jgi:cysteine-rich repeat protein
MRPQTLFLVVFVACAARDVRAAWPPVCGNGVREPTEQCDLGAGVNSDTAPDACRTNCILPHCGDGVTDPGIGEQCDDANANQADGCRGCLLPTCGGGVVDAGLGEQCEDGNGIDRDACTNACRWNVCGDGVVFHSHWGGTEACDQGALNGNGPNSYCTTACAFHRCGDGIVSQRLKEQCDLGAALNGAPGSGCTAGCRVG